MTTQIEESEVLYLRLNEYLAYERAIKGRPERSVQETSYDLQLLTKFLLHYWKRVPSDLPYEDTDISGFSDKDLQSIKLTDLYAFVNWLATTRKAKASTRARKISSIRSFFKFLDLKLNLLEYNYSLNLELPKKLKQQPRHLSLEESQTLLQTTYSADDACNVRDYCMITLFLNCGMRLSELFGLDITDYRGTTMRLLGKGGKERTAYLNDACLKALTEYLPWRQKTLHHTHKSTDALFVSIRGERLSRRMIQYIVKHYLMMSGIDTKRYSTHKLRHTAATLMYQHGNVDIRSLQAILGHSSISTTEIYTHLHEEKLHAAIESHPLAGFGTQIENKPKEKGE